MTSSRAALSREDVAPPLDPVLQSKLAAKFGPKLMRLGFTALPVLVQQHYRYVPGNALYEYDSSYDKESRTWIKQPETKRLVCEVSHMTPTEYALMTAIWSYWWTNESDPWPSVERLCEQLGKSERQVRRLLQRLRDKGFMLSVEQYNYEHKQISNRYDFTPFLRKLVDYLEALEWPAQPDKASGEGVKNGGESVSESAGSGCQNGQGIEDKSDPDFSNIDTLDSSGSAASSKGTVLSPSTTYSHMAHKAIGKTEKGTEETEEIESDRTSNPPPASQKLAAGERAKEVIQENTGEKVSKWEEFVLASGVPLERLYALETWVQKRPRPEQTPLLVQALIDPISQQFDNGRLMVSNRTQAAKLYLYAREQGLRQEELEDAFREWVHTAFIHVPPHVTKKMAWFFRALKVELLKGLMFMVWPPAPLQGFALSEEETAAPVTEPCEASYHPMREILLTPEDDSALGWSTPEHAAWCAWRLCGDLGPERYEYEVLPTQYQRWGVEFRRRSDHQVEDIFLSKEEMYAYRAKVRARDALLQVLIARVDSGQAPRV